MGLHRRRADELTEDEVNWFASMKDTRKRSSNCLGVDAKTSNWREKHNAKPCRLKLTTNSKPTNIGWT